MAASPDSANGWLLAAAKKREALERWLELPPTLWVEEAPAPLPAGRPEALLHWGFSLERLEECARTYDSVQWVHSFWAGTERIEPVIRKFAGSPRFTCSRGLYQIPMAEHVVGLVLGLVRELHHLRDQQARSEWQHRIAGELHGRRALIVGAGGIGARVGKLLQAFGVDVRGVRRDPSVELGFPSIPPDEVDRWLPETDVLILSLPHTDRTRGWFDDERLRRLPRGAVLINVGRGSVLDEHALARLLRDGHLAGAALDVFAEEPLPSDSPLWTIPELWISPHCSGASPAMDRRRCELWARNLKSYRAGDPLENEVT